MGWYQRVFVGTGRAPAVLMLIGFLVTFAVTRAITRRIRARASAARTQPQFRDKRPHRQPADPSRQVSVCRTPHLGGSFLPARALFLVRNCLCCPPSPREAGLPLIAQYLTPRVLTWPYAPVGALVPAREH